MSSLWEALIIALVPSLLVAVTTAFLTVRLSLRQFRTQHWWERKAQAYTDIVESLHRLIHYSEWQETEILGGYLGPERRAKLEKGFDAAHDDLTKTANVGDFIISRDVADALEKLMIFESPRTTKFYDRTGDEINYTG